MDYKFDLIFTFIGNAAESSQQTEFSRERCKNQAESTELKSLFGNFNGSVSGESIQQRKNSITTGATSTSSQSHGKQGRILLRDYLYLMNKNSKELIRDAKSRDKAQIRQKKYQLDQQKVFYLMQDQMKSQLTKVIERLQKIKQSIKSQTFKDVDKTNSQNISIVYNIRNIIKDKFKKGIEEINMIFFQEQQRIQQMFNPPLNKQSETIKSHNCFDNKANKKKQHKISLQIHCSPLNEQNNCNRENYIAINGSKFMADFV